MLVPTHKLQIVNISPPRNHTRVLPDGLHEELQIVLRHDKKTQIRLAGLECLGFAEFFEHYPVETHVGPVRRDVSGSFAVPTD